VPDALGDRLDRGAGHFSAAVENEVGPVAREASDYGRTGSGIQPGEFELLVVDLHDLVCDVLRDRQPEPLLRLGAGDDLRRQVRYGDGNLVEPQLYAHSAVRGHLAAHTGDTAGAEILETEIDASLEQHVEHPGIRLGDDPLQERVSDLNGSHPQIRIEIGGREGGSTESRGVRGLPYQDEHVGSAPGGAGNEAVDDPVVTDEPYGHDVHEAVRFVSLMEDGIPAQVRNAESVAVLPYSLHHTPGHRPRGRGGGGAEPE